MTLRAVPFQASHYYEMVINREFRRQIESHGNVGQLLMAYERHAIAVTCYGEDGIIVGVFGVMPMWEGVGDIFMFCNDRINDHVFFIRKIKKLFDAGKFGDKLFRRFQATANTQYPKHGRLLKFLGFQKEGTARRFVGDMDYDYYGKLVV